MLRGVDSPRTPPLLTPAHSRTQSLEAERFVGGGGAGGLVADGGAGVGGGGVYSYSMGAEQCPAALEMGQRKEDVYTSSPSVRQVQQGKAVIAGLEDAHRRMQVS